MNDNKSFQNRSARGKHSALDPSPLACDLHALWQQGRSAWPQISVPFSAFCEQARSANSGVAANVDAADLYLACGGTIGDEVALRTLDEEIFRRIPQLISRLRPTNSFSDEVTQQVRLRLLVAEPGARPRIATYSGAGSLLSFVRVTAVRLALNLRKQRGESSELPIPDEAKGRSALVGHELDPELRYLKERYRRDFEAALAEAFAELPVRQRNLLRLRFIGQLTDEKIGIALGVHQTTVTRWLAAARSAVLTDVRSRLKQRLQISSSEFESLIALVQSQLNVDLPAVLCASGTGRNSDEVR